ncbi:enoyl-CoA hydratase/isomerase family protein [Novosphingobium piscinae]|uniref:Enoyl-CoA hydratase/isomerase family protein n=1 Tax=Novosphingobium piscinae TaxID=1507448 RepID=A0A7X1FVH4_9SPHN|nr:enoyl-CoA hydratase/isomerase family protein [Novosphingobium piscinae]MBC2667711.1 enoyl-CoA hydratase/isomerase family protein [Novosphingobium piscinae]
MAPDLPLLPAAALLALPWAEAPLPVAVIDLAREAAGSDGGACALPPFPVIGLGTPDHPLAPRLDAVVPDHAEAALIVRNCTRNPQAAAVLVQLLRIVAALPPTDALVAESLAYGLLQGGAEHRHWRAARGAAAPVPPGTVAVTRTGDTLAVVMDRPQALNAIDRAMRDALREAFDIAALDPAVRRVTLEGRGRAFSVGAELAEFGTTTDPLVAHAIRRQTLPAHALVRCASRLEARVHGACVGSGLEMAAFAATVLARPSAWFQLPELAMGLIPGAGGCVALTHRIGRALTARLVLSGRRMSAQTALDWGLVDRIVDGPDWAGTAQAAASGVPTA